MGAPKSLTISQREQLVIWITAALSAIGGFRVGELMMSQAVAGLATAVSTAAWTVLLFRQAQRKGMLRATGLSIVFGILNSYTSYLLMLLLQGDLSGLDEMGVVLIFGLFYGGIAGIFFIVWLILPWAYLFSQRGNDEADASLRLIGVLASWMGLVTLFGVGALEDSALPRRAPLILSAAFAVYALYRHSRVLSWMINLRRGRLAGLSAIVMASEGLPPVEAPSGSVVARVAHAGVGPHRSATTHEALARLPSLTDLVFRSLGMGVLVVAQLVFLFEIG